jgi:hypothetical protein
MGSSGSGNLTDYQGYNSSSGGQGGTSGVDKCKKAFYETLEEVSNCSYYTTNNNVPVVGTHCTVIFANPRLAVVDDNGLTMGYLPTKYNYLRACMTAGISYEGVVSFSNVNPIPTISVDISPV